MVIYRNGEKIYEFNEQELKALITSIQGNLSSNYLTKDTIANMIANARSLYQVAELPASPSRNTMYYVGTAKPYHVYLYDSAGQQIDMGESELELSNYYTKEEADNMFMLRQNFLNTLYPKGSIYITYENVNPSTFLGGTWELISKGRALFGYDPNDADFASGATGGGKKSGVLWATNWNESLSDYAITKGINSNPITITSGDTLRWNHEGYGLHSGAVSYGEKGSTTDNIAKKLKEVRSIDDSGNVQDNSLPPYQVVYVWKRTDDTQTAYQLTPLNILNEMPSNPTNDTVLGTKAAKDYIDAGTKVTMKNITCTKTSLISSEFYFGGNFIDLGSGTGFAFVRGGFRPETAVGNGSGICYLKVGDKNLLGLDNAIGYVFANNNSTPARFCQSQLNGNQLTARDLTIGTGIFYWLNIAYPAKLAS